MATEFDKFLKDQANAKPNASKQIAGVRKPVTSIPKKNLIKKQELYKDNIEFEEAMERLRQKHPKIAEFILPLLDSKNSQNKISKKTTKHLRYIIIACAILFLINPILMGIVIIGYVIFKKSSAKNAP